MSFKSVSLFATAWWVLGAASVHADGRVALTSAELDDVTAVARYAPAQVGEIREASADDRTDLERLPRALVQEIDDLGDDPAQPRTAADHLMPAMAATPTPADPAPAAITPPLPAVTSLRPTPTRQAAVSPSPGDAHGSTARQPSPTIRHQEGNLARASRSETVARAVIRSSPADQPGPRDFAVMRRPEPALRDTIRQVRSEAPWLRRVLDHRNFSPDRRFSPRR